MTILPLLLLFLTGCSVNPTTGRSQLALISTADEVALGEQSKAGLTSEFGGAVPDGNLQGYLTDMGRRMAATTEGNAPQLPWEFTLLNSDVINAFALPGGKVFISRGLARRMTNEAQLAAVVGHEIGHVTARHFVDRHSTNLLINIGVVAVGVLAETTADGSEAGQIGRAAVPALAVGGQLYQLSYGRNQEIEADKLGMRYMTRVGYNPIGARQMMEVLAEAASGQERQPELLSTHPYPERRIQQIDRELASTYRNTGGDFHERRFQTAFLRRLAALEDAPDVMPHRMAIAMDPSQWCALCALDAD